MIQRAIDAARGAARAITLKAVEKAQREAQALLTEFEQERRVTLDEASAAKATALANVWPQAQMRTENKPQVQAQLEVIKHEMLTAAIEREEKYELEKMETAIAHAGRELTKAVELAQASAMLQGKEAMKKEIVTAEVEVRKRVVHEYRVAAESQRALAVAEAEARVANEVTSKLHVVNDTKLKAVQKEVEDLERKAKLSDKMLQAVINQKTAPSTNLD